MEAPTSWKRILMPAIAGLVLTPLGGCTPREPMAPIVLDQSSPEAVVATLDEAWRRKDPDIYAALLRHDFVFRFQPGQAPSGGTDPWTRGEDVTAVHALFTSPLFEDIRTALTIGPAAPATDVPGAMHVRISPMILELDVFPDVTFRVNDAVQDMFFRNGDPDRGEDPALWYLVEWRDIPTKSAAVAVEQTTWGLIKTLGQQ